MRYMKKFISLITAISLAALYTVNVYGEILPNFSQINYYNNSVYDDVSADEWYYNYVGFVYEYGIMTGTAQNLFSPDGNLTIAEAITIAARLNAVYYGNTIDTSNYSSSPLSWFTAYLAYAEDQGIISAAQFGGRYVDNATREELAYILFRALPSCYAKINDITPIPDVYTDNKYYSEILSLYEAGVITGNDEYGTFCPLTGIQRSEVAAMVSRAINPDLRVSFTLNPNIPFKLLNYTWKYPYRGTSFSLNIDISYYDYIYFSSKPRTYDYASYATDDADVTGLTALATTLQNMAIENGLTSAYDVAAFITAFVQNIPYMDDYEYKGVSEYPKYPIETLFEQGGDCEDTAVLLAKLLKLLGYGAVLLVSDNHMAVGLQTSGNGNLSFNGVEYYYIETTEAGWRVGEVPGDMLGTTISVVYI